MKELDKAIKHSRVLVFMDLEGTQFSHEMTSIAAFKVYLKDDLTIKRIMRPYTSLVRVKHRVGPFVSKLTGITDEMLKKDGQPFRVVQQGLRKYLGRDWQKCRFVTYGSHDMTIIMSSAENNMDASMEEARFITHHFFDFSEFLARFVKGEDGNPLSLSRALQRFEIPFEGEAHDATADTRNLVRLYEAFLKRKDILKEEYKKTLARLNHFPSPVQKAMNALSKGASVGAQMYDQWVAETFE